MAVIKLHAAIVENNVNRYVWFYHSDTEKSVKVALD